MVINDDSTLYALSCTSMMTHKFAYHCHHSHRYGNHSHQASLPSTLSRSGGHELLFVEDSCKDVLLGNDRDYTGKSLISPVKWALNFHNAARERA